MFAQYAGGLILLLSCCQHSAGSQYHDLHWEASFWNVLPPYGHRPNSFWPPPLPLCQTGTVRHFFWTLFFPLWLTPWHKKQGHKVCILPAIGICINYTILLLVEGWVPLLLLWCFLTLSKWTNKCTNYPGQGIGQLKKKRFLSGIARIT